MSLRLSSTSSKNSTTHFIIEDVRDPKTKKRTTRTYKKLGSSSSLKATHNLKSDEELAELLNSFLEQAKAEYDDYHKEIVLSFKADKRLPLGKQLSYNVGYLAPQKILSTLQLQSVCDLISEKHKYKYDLGAILRDLVLTRLIYPGSKRSSYAHAGQFLDQPQYKLDDVYRSLKFFDEDRYLIEKTLYENSAKIANRDHSILYYDCTNFYFEIEDEDGMKLYGKSKENRPNPIVQYGLFMDASGIPLADTCFEGSANEQSSLRKLEKQLDKDFGLSRYVVCADAGLNGFENKIFNDKDKNKAYIVTQPVKKLDSGLKEWALQPEGWRLLDSDQTFNINELGSETVVNGVPIPTHKLVFYKDRWTKKTKKSQVTGKKETLEEHLIISYSTKYRDYCRRIRDKKLERARKLLKNPGNIKVRDERNPRYYLKSIHSTEDGVVSEEVTYSIDTEKVAREERFDGFYGVCTDLEDQDISLVIAANRNRWEIEESFQIMKSELKTRPIYVSRDESIKGHLLTCFIALLVFRILEQYLDYKYSAYEIFECLREMDVTVLTSGYYRPSFTRTQLTDDIREVFGYELDTEVIQEKNLRKFLRNSKSKKITQKSLYKKSS